MYTSILYPLQSEESEVLFERLVSSNSLEVGKLLHGAMLRKFPDIGRIEWHVSFDQLFQWKMWPNFIELMRKNIN